MSVYHRSTAKSRILQEYREREEEISAALSRQISHKNGVEGEKRLRRAIANSNERRRMQSINHGFQLLRTLLPHSEGEKLSKAAILQQTTEFIHNLEQDNAKLSAQNNAYKRLLGEVSRKCNIDLELDISLYGGSPPLKRKKRDTESSDEGITADYEDFKHEDIRREVGLLRQQLDKERQRRMYLELHANRHYTTPESVQPLTTPVEPPPLTTPVEPPVPTPLPPLQPVIEKPVEDCNPEPMSVYPPVQVEQEPDHRVPGSPKHKPDAQGLNTHFRSYLETLSEAARLVESKTDEPAKPPCSKALAAVTTDHAQLQFYAPHGTDSEDNTYITSDQEDLHSECSGRDSPSAHSYVRLQSAHCLRVQPVSAPQLTSPKLLLSNSNYSEKYPAVANVLQGNSPQVQMYYRPGVIVQKS
ncbi:TFAP4-like protein [Mya arenaria]|uniref:TFAP4-like protein n=1 Tax=Mya arenaria TaxID=6604 RepID=A0ABY7DTM2_MYAAR|nr:transcription factor AP-4-like [Mya arenaria]XP_052796815.1 transcription factor AP-4-like [Mya arenaria]WAQ99964.1 TFAP4-like protein [Mya arenaria]WAQ99993.1 TFAP4-like protein [Mya arenaria]